MRSPKHRLRLNHILFTVLITIVLAFVLFPLLWVISTSLKNSAETFATPPYIIPKLPTLDNFVALFRNYDFAVYFVNSSITAMLTTALCLVVANLAAYGFSRYQMRFGKALLMFILVSQMIPSVLFVIPYFLMMGKVGLINSRLAIVIAHTSFALPFCTWMLQGYYESIPKSIDEAGKIDGCSRFQVLSRIVLPLTLPGNVATLVFSFMQSWNEYLFSMTLTTSERMFTIPVRIAMFMGEYKTQWNELMAAALLTSIPVVIIYLLVDKHLIDSLTAGAVRQ